MANKLSPVVYRDWSTGLIDSVSNFLLPENALKFAENVHVDEFDGNLLGDVKGRKGYTIIGSQIEAGKSILGMHNFLDKTGTPDRLIAVVNDSGDTESRTYYWDGASWTEIGTTPTNWTASKKTRFTTFLDYVFLANGTDAISTWEGTPATDWGTTNATSAETGNIIVNFYDRVNIAGNSTKPSSIYYSNFPSGGAITWTANELEVNPDDNDAITALEPNSGILLVFKNRGLYTWNGQQTQSDKIIDVGAVSQEAVTTVRGITYFFGETKESAAIFEYRGQYPIEISRPVRKWIEAIDSTDYDDVISFADEDHVYFGIGDVTYEGVDYTNVMLRYTVSKGTWTMYSTADEIQRGIERIQSDGTRSIVIGDDDGQVHTWNSGNTDNGTNISYRFRTKELEFGSRNVEKTINGLAVYASKPQSALIRARVDGDKWTTLGRLSKESETIKTNLRGKYFEFEVAVENTGVDQFVFDGIEFFDVKTERYEQ